MYILGKRTLRYIVFVSVMVFSLSGVLDSFAFTKVKKDNINEEESLPPLEQAMVMLDTIACLPIEGIWEYPGEDLKVLIRKQPAYKTESYDITVLEAFSPTLSTGERLGWLTPCAESGKYELHQYTRRKKGFLDLPGKCVVTLGKNQRSLLISAPEKLTVSLSPFTLLPRFMRIIRLRIKGGAKEPAEGLRKLYPSDTPGLLHEDIRML